LSLALDEANGQVIGAAVYATDLFDRTTIERWIGFLKAALARMIREPTCPIDALPLSSETAPLQMPAGFATIQADARHDKSIHRVFEEWARQAPDSIAVTDEDRNVTYRQLNERANQLAWFLRAQGMNRGRRVLLVLPRSLQMLVAQLAVLKNG